MASMRDIKRRKTSIQGTQQITKAMKLVSTVKLQRARAGAERSQTYFDCMYATMTSLLAKAGNINHPYLKADDSKKKAVIVVTSNRGLAGGYNSNVVKMVTENETFTKENIRIYAVGGKGLELLKHKGYDIVADYSEMIEEPSYDDAKSITKRLLTDFENGDVNFTHNRHCRSSCISRIFRNSDDSRNYQPGQYCRNYFVPMALVCVNSAHSRSNKGILL